ncbi:PTS ascorbate transporter subunit IIC [Lactiplantibacillus pentosus]|uniref:PTS ascorbate transporter subunit IIC n=1 Tax=Lactiplantibacillus sp. 7.2.4 TaxID=2832296 RepID=UPI000D0223D8|nr:PTS ascorbate transporter subunit IIC [Lactiplantibacillus pentosus]MBU7448570.1 PTS ascorbate transporter subunit IIC [Lactiplantibacillus sp. 7.2.4]MBU7481076.1 PTS ascorbate transporter subunit IIC [Lactiplantibacillus pentosus]MBU7502212.1 PTS ascorbate transporter subunit IIC [Lactiplantibacillus pentosus]MCT3064513.1 PTS ascorbate transporter subunit IIC [Lactiplantibacillus pentosus]MCT3285005.1 PTS ascorbate transporter subunit IIC [Lactiplantibacillus pentosus]
MNWIATNILQNPPILLGLIAALGLAIQKKKIDEIVKGSLTAAFGMLILTEGVNMLTTIIANINTAVQTQMGVKVAKGLSDITFTADYGGAVGMAMFFGLIVHLLIARFTPIKTIFLTGHMLWWVPFVIVAGLVEAGVKGVLLVVLGAIISACYWSCMPWIMRKYVWAATGDDSFLIGHPTGILSLISGFVAKHVGNKSHSTEDLKIPEGLSFFREISITGGLVMFIVDIVVGIIAPSLVPSGSNVVMYALNQGLTFGAGLLILLYGVRLLINQIVPAFQGIAEKVVPGAKPAFDVPILFNYRPNAVIIGFLTAMITSTILVVVANSVHLFGILIVPMVITSFFECGGAAVIGEGQGGLRGAIVGTAVASVAMIALVGFSAILLGSTIRNWILIFGGNDLSLWGMFAEGVGRLFGGF